MKSKISNIYFLILGLLIFGTVSVSAAILLQADEVSFTSDKTSQTTVQGALDELYGLSQRDCPVGQVCRKCTAGTYANQETGECVACPSGYTSDAEAGKETDCYIETTAGKYIATANSSTQTTCPANSYCPSTIVKYGSTGNIISCPSGKTSNAGSSSSSDCSTPYTYTKTAPANGYSDGSTGTWTATYTCENGTATMTSCAYSGTHGSATCNGGSVGLTPTYMCTYSASRNAGNLTTRCNSSLPTPYVYGGGLPSTESC